jgi:hypothetical protein
MLLDCEAYRRMTILTDLTYWPYLLALLTGLTYWPYLLALLTGLTYWPYFLTCSSRVKPLSLSHLELRSLSIASVIRSAAPPWMGVLMAWRSAPLRMYALAELMPAWG